MFWPMGLSFREGMNVQFFLFISILLLLPHPIFSQILIPDKLAHWACDSDVADNKMIVSRGD